MPLPDADARRATASALTRSRQERQAGAARSEVDSPGRDPADRWPGGRYEIHRASDDSLARSTMVGGDTPTLGGDPARRSGSTAEGKWLVDMAQHLPDSDLTGEKPHGFAYERTSDAFRYDRVQGMSFGAGIGCGCRGELHRPLWDRALRRQRRDGHGPARAYARRGRGGSSVSGYHDIVDQWTRSRPGTTSATRSTRCSWRTTTPTTCWRWRERRSATRRRSRPASTSASAAGSNGRGPPRKTGSELNDFLGGTGSPAQPSGDEGTFGGAYVRLAGVRDTRWTVTADVLGARERTTRAGCGRPAARASGRAAGSRCGVKAGVATTPALQQSAFRAGRREHRARISVRHRRGQSFWAAQADVTPIAGAVRPVLFLDAGRADGRATVLRQGAGGRGHRALDFSELFAPASSASTSVARYPADRRATRSPVRHRPAGSPVRSRRWRHGSPSRLCRAPAGPGAGTSRRVDQPGSALGRGSLVCRQRGHGAPHAACSRCWVSRATPG